MQLKINNEKIKKYKNKILLSSVLILLISLAVFLTTSIHWGLIENNVVYNIKNYGFNFYGNEDREFHKGICIIFTIFLAIGIISSIFGIISALKMKNDNLIYNLNDNKITHNVSEKVLNLEEKNLKISIYKNKEINLGLIKNVGFITENHIKKGFIYKTFYKIIKDDSLLLSLNDGTYFLIKNLEDRIETRNLIEEKINSLKENNKDSFGLLG